MKLIYFYACGGWLVVRLLNLIDVFENLFKFMEIKRSLRMEIAKNRIEKKIV